VRIDFGDFSVVRFQGRVRVVPRRVFSPVPSTQWQWNGEAELDMGGAGYLHFRPAVGEGVSLLGSRVLIRLRRPGDRFRLSTGQLQRPLKDLLREAGIPPWLRPWLPVVEVDGRAAWVAGLGAAAEYRTEPGGQGWAISWAPPW
jgi:tRNA(Ile)-lysidine synthase